MNLEPVLIGQLHHIPCYGTLTITFISMIIIIITRLVAASETQANPNSNSI